MDWLQAHWHIITLGLLLAINILNAATKHWSQHTGAVKVLLFIVDCLSVVKSCGELKWPGPGKAAALALALAVSMSACAPAKLTPMQTLEKVQIAVDGARQVAVPGFHIVCQEYARKCIASGITSADNCPDYLKCDEARRVVVASLQVAYVSVLEAATLIALGRADSAEAKIAAAKEALSRAWDLLNPILSILKGGK